MILICFDGSDDARAAIEHAGRLLRGQPATVLTVWEPFTQVLVRTTFGPVPLSPEFDVVQIDAATRRHAEELAEEGAGLAREAGLEAQARTCPQIGTIALSILQEAEKVDATAIVIGSRGLTGMKSLLLGSVSSAVVQRADRAVIVVPSPKVAAERQEARQSDT